MNHTILSSATLVAISLIAASVGVADDLNPPPWRGDPLTTSAEWEFLTNMSSLDPDGTDVPLVVGDGLLGTNPIASIIGPMTWDSFDGDGAWIGSGIPGELGFIELIIPNWIDMEPIKYLQIQMTVQPVGGPGGISPFVDSIVPADSVDPIREVSLDNVVETPLGGVNGLVQRTEFWRIRPNPDSEVIMIGVPSDSLVDQIVIDTISTIPEPSALVLAISALLTGWLLRRP